MRTIVWILLPGILCGCEQDRGNGGDGAPVAGGSEVVFDENEVNDFALTMAPADWDAIINDAAGGVWREATLAWKTEIVQRVGVLPAGESRVPGNPKMSLGLRFDAFVSGQRWHDLAELRLDGMSHDPSFMRDRLAYGVFRQRIPAPRSAHGRLLVNGVLRGVYEVEERVDASMMRNRFGGEVGDLYRIDGFGTKDPYLWVDSNASSYMPWPWVPITVVPAADRQRVVNFIDVINRTPASLGSACDVETLLEYLAADAAIMDVDGLTGDYGTFNHYQYFLPEQQWFVLIPWDMDSTWDDPPTRSIFENFQNNRLTALIEGDPVLRSRYKLKISDVIAGPTLPANVHARIDSIYFQIRDAVYADPNKPFTNEAFDDQRTFLKWWVEQRHANLQTQVAQP